MDKEHPKRTNQQNRATHLLMTQIADGLNDSGLSMMRVLRHDAEIPWTPIAVKEYLLRPFLRAMYGKTSTTELDTKEIGDAIDALCIHLLMATGKSFEMPSIETLLHERQAQEK